MAPEPTEERRLGELPRPRQGELDGDEEAVRQDERDAGEKPNREPNGIHRPGG